MQRIFEIIPGALTWLTLILMVLLAWLMPTQAAIFIIAFDLLWLIRLLYLHFYLRYSFKQLRTNLKIDWLEKLKNVSSDWQKIKHLIILPMYNEPYALIRESFITLAKSNYPIKKDFFVVLATEKSG